MIALRRMRVALALGLTMAAPLVPAVASASHPRETRSVRTDAGATSQASHSSLHSAWHVAALADSLPARHPGAIHRTSLIAHEDPTPPPPPQDWTPTQAEVDAAVEAKTGVAAPGLPNGGHNCYAENYGTTTGSQPPAEDYVTPLRPDGSTLAFLAHPILNGLFVQYYACWPLGG